MLTKNDRMILLLLKNNYKYVADPLSPNYELRIPNLLIVFLAVI